MRTALLAATIVVVQATACSSGGEEGADPAATSTVPATTDASATASTLATASTVVAGEPAGEPTTGSGPSDVTSTVPAPVGTFEDGRPLPVGDQPEVIGPLGSTELDIETDGGSVQIGTGDVPAIVPEAFPVPADFVVQLATEAGEQAGFSGTTQLSFVQLVDFYLGGLADAGYAVSEEQFVADTVAVLAFDGPDGRGRVAIGGSPEGGRSVLVTFER